MRFLKNSDSLAYIPTPMGMQEFIIQTSHYQVDRQKIELDYQLQNQEGHPFASYQLEITWARLMSFSNLAIYLLGSAS